MSNLVVSTFIANGSLWLYLDNDLVTSNSDVATLALREGEQYFVRWFVMGTVGTSYSITISSPSEAQFQLTRVVDGSGKGSGDLRFKA